MIKDDIEFKELGANFYNQFNTEKKINSYLKKLKELGWDGTIEPNQTNSTKPSLV